MVAMVFKLTYRGAVPSIQRRHWRAILRAAYYHLGVFWHRELRKKHFTHRGAREYHYRKRQGEPGGPRPRGKRKSYTARKLAKFGHTYPLVYTGASMRASRIREVRATYKGARVILHTPTLSRVPGAEMRRISRREMTQMQRLFDRFVDAKLRGIKDVRRRTISM